MLFFGAGVFVMQAYLMSEWFGDYRSLFVGQAGRSAPLAWSSLCSRRAGQATLRWLSYTVGAISTVWIVGHGDWRDPVEQPRGARARRR